MSTSSTKGSGLAGPTSMGQWATRPPSSRQGGSVAGCTTSRTATGGAGNPGGAAGGGGGGGVQGPPGCQEEDTSGYLSDTPKNPHTPDIWFNDGASQIESISGMGSASVLDGGSVGAVGGGVAGCRRLRRSIMAGSTAAPIPAPMSQLQLNLE